MLRKFVPGALREIARRFRPARRPDYAALGRQHYANLPGAPVVFAGDSEVWNASLGELVGRAANRGIAGQTVSDVASWIDLILDRPELERLVIWAGTNDILAGVPSVDAVRDMRRLVAHVGERRPEVTVVLLSLPPLGNHPSAVAEMNAALRKLAKEVGVELLDVTTPLASASGLMASDDVHVMPAGYAVLAPILRQAAGVRGGWV